MTAPCATIPNISPTTIPRPFTPATELALALLRKDSAMTLIIRDQLTCPPSWFASYRDLTLYCAVMLKLDIVLESDEPDLYYHWIKPRGGMDFIGDIVRPGSEPGVHLDFARHFPRTIVTDRIAPENVHHLIAAIQMRAA